MGTTARHTDQTSQTSQTSQASGEQTLTLRRAEERGHFDHGWLDTHHTFSFGEYRDLRHMGFRALRVINDDRVAPGAGFPNHPHRDMEIVTYVLDGALEHKDSTGTGSVIHAGSVQRMTAGTGIVHSEFNHSKEEPVRFLQIWIVPDTKALAPGYEEIAVSREEKHGQLRLIASPDGGDGVVEVHQDARIFATLLGAGNELRYTPRPGRYTWVQVARGRARVGDVEVEEGDGVAVRGDGALHLTGIDAAELLLFDLN